MTSIPPQTILLAIPTVGRCSQCAPPDRIMKGNGNGHGCSFHSFLHNPMLPRCRTGTNPFCSRIRQTSDPGTRSLPNRYLDLRDENFAAEAPTDFGRSAVSKNRVSASIRLVRASSIDEPWLAISSSGHSATNPSSSRSMIAVTRCDCTMLRVYNTSLGPVVGVSDFGRL